MVAGGWRALSYCVLPPWLLGRRVLARLMYANPRLVQALAGFEAAAGLLREGGPAHNPRILAALGAEVHPSAMIYSPLTLHGRAGSFANLSVARGAHVGREVFIDLSDRVTIGPDSTISMRTTILTHMDVGRSPLLRVRYPRRTAPVTLGSGCYVGAGATILAGSTIGENAVVAAGAVVTADVERDAIVAGIPARPVGEGASAPARPR